MRVPLDATRDVQEGFRQVWQALNRLSTDNIDLSGRRIINAGTAVSPGDYVTQSQADRDYGFDRFYALLKARGLDGFPGVLADNQKTKFTVTTSAGAMMDRVTAVDEAVIYETDTGILKIPIGSGYQTLSATGSATPESGSGNLLRVDGTTTLTGARTIAGVWAFVPSTGTVPFTTTKTGLVTNLNADQTDSCDAETSSNTLATLDGTGTFSGARTVSGVWAFEPGTGTVPFTTTKTGLVTNLNADKTDSCNAETSSNTLATLDGTGAFSGARNVTALWSFKLGGTSLQVAPTTGTNSALMGFASTGGSGFVGTEASSGGTTFVGTTAYAMFIATANATVLQFGTNNNIRATIDTSGNFSLGVLTAKSFLYSDASKNILSTSAPTDGQLLIGSTGNVPVAATLTAGDGISVTNAAGAITLATTSGLYTPTLTNTTNVAASTAYECQYARIGDVVIVSGKVDVDPTAAASTVLTISLPVASNLANPEQLAGTAFCPAIAGQGAAIVGDATNDKALMWWVAVDITNQPMYFTFMYQVV